MDRDQIDELVKAVSNIAPAGRWGTSGLEMLSETLSGDNPKIPLSWAVDELGTDVSDAISLAGNNLSYAIRELASAVRGLSQ